MLEHFRAKSILACSYKFVGLKDLNNVKKAIIGCYLKKMFCSKHLRSKTVTEGCSIWRFSSKLFRFRRDANFQIYKFLI